VKATVEASPSLALIKYWGKQDGDRNVPATSSLAITLEGLWTRTTVECAGDDDRIEVNGALQPTTGRFAALFGRVREATGYAGAFAVRSRNNFATAAGLASSSSGFAALAAGCIRATGTDLADAACSAIARVGSASAARSVFGGFTVLREGAEAAEKIHDASHWPELRVVVCTVREAAKVLSSGSAMELTKRSSPFFSAWLEDARLLFEDALGALAERNLPRLGELMRQSYLRMHATLLGSSPPVIYFEGDSLRIIALCAELRRTGVDAWETMDAGPQVKILCTAEDADVVVRALARELPALKTTVCRIGTGVRPTSEEVT
jgi:diphosphomevalonate decarboxylase